MGGAVVMAFFMHWLGRYVFMKCKKDKMDALMLEGLVSAGT